MIVDYYRNHRIEVNAVQAAARWNAEVRTRRLFARDKPRVETVTCLKLGAEHAERAGIYGRGVGLMCS